MVWLDLDDTLWDFKANSHDSLLEVYDHFKLQRFWPDSELWLDAYHTMNDRLWTDYAAAVIDRDTLRRERFRTPFVEAGMDADEAERITPEVDRYYLTRLGLRGLMVEGAEALVDRLRADGFRLGILSNGFKEVQYNKMKSSGLDDKFDTIVLSDDIEINKPDIRIYRYAEQKAGVGPDRCIMIGDNDSTDIAGALDAGWIAVWYNPAKKCPGAALSSRLAHQTTLAVVNNLDSIKL